MMRVPLEDLAGVRHLDTPVIEDSRGWFSETWSRRRWLDLGVDVEWVQDNHSLSTNKGTLRGLHFQSPPFAQDKLVRVIRGAIFDVIVDLRSSSPTFGKHAAFEMNAASGGSLFVPAGFAHGFVTLEENTEISYKVSAVYSPGHESGVLWSDPDLAIEWPLPPSGPILSERDKTLRRFGELGPVFA